jgi:hypothetical protein
MPVPDYQIRFYVSLFGRHSRAGDVVDNIPGTLYDAATKAEIIRGDSSKLAPGSTHDLHWSKDPPITYLAIAPWLPATKTPAQAIEVNNAIFDQAPDWVRALMTGDYPEKKTRRRKKSQ